MRKINWNNKIKMTKNIKKNIKTLKKNNIEDLGDTGFYNDAKKGLVKISECKDSTLRRYVKELEKYYQLITEPINRQKIVDKKKEIELEQQYRYANGITIA